MIKFKHLAFLLVAFTWFEGLVLFEHRIIILYGLLLGGAWLFLNTKNILKKDIVFTKEQFYFLTGLLLFLAWGLLSLTWAELTQVAKERAFYIIGAVGFTIIILDQFREQKDWITAYKILVISGLVSSLLVFSQAYFGMDRAVGYISPDSNFTAMRMTALVPLAYFWAKTIDRIPRIFLLGGILVTLLAIISTGSRAGMVATIATIIIISFYELKDKSAKKVFITSLILILAGIILVSEIAPEPLQTGINRFDNLIGTIKRDIPPDVSISERYALFKAGPKMFYDNFLLGVGLGNFQVHSIDYGVKRNIESHNTYIEIATELGVIGATVFFSLIYYTLTKFKLMEKTHSNTPFHTFILGCKISFFSILINFLFLTALTDRRFYLLMAFVFGIQGGKQVSLKDFIISIKQIFIKKLGII
ncbi:O-antigen ligase family protein [Candidatus Pacearchaeota archaeon]|nr:O-antigen ligase family protein [Candidatus Pacearchaeota archaeon]